MKGKRFSGIRSRFISLILAALWLAAPAVVAAQTIQFDVPAQPLAAALDQFARQAGLQLAFSPDLAKGKTSTPVSGMQEVQKALTELLRGTGLKGGISGSTLTVERLSEGQSGSEAQMPVVQVEGEPTVQERSAWSPVEGYVAKRSATGTKTDTPLIETPRSISVIGAEEIDDRKSTKVSEALRYTPGVVAESRGIDFSQGFAIIRGFGTASFYQDGSGQEIAYYSNTGLEPYGMERIEVLRGPASVLYGRGQAGGMINTVTKRPTDEFFAEIEGNAGSFNQFGGRFDIGGPMDEGKEFLFRLTGLARDGDTQVDTFKEGRTYIAPAFTWQPTVDTSLTILSHFQRDDTVGGQFVPSTALTNPIGSISTSTLLSEPGFEKWDRDEASIGYLFEHRFNDRFSLRQKLRYDKFDLDYDNINAQGFQADNRTLNREVFTALEDGDNVTSDTSLEVKTELGATRHTILFGVDTKSTSISRTFTSGPAPSIDAFDPVYGQTITIGPVYLDEDQSMDQLGVYLQDQIKILDKWVLSLGGRHDAIKSNIHDKLADTQSPQDDNAFTGQVGLVYLAENGLAPYASFATSFEPQLGTDMQGNAFVPTTGTQYEGGIKYQPKESAGSVILSVFEITRQNVLTSDPVDVNFYAQTGEVRSRGLEIEGKFSFLESWNLTAAYTYMDAKVTQSNDGDQGNRLGAVPRHAASLWADHAISSGALNGLEVGAGVRYVGSTPDFSNTVEVPAFTIVDAALYYRFRTGSLSGMKMAINASNLLDKTYLSSCDGESWCFFGQRRTITASLGYRW